jgi:hypothetical protein
VVEDRVGRAVKFVAAALGTALAVGLLGAMLVQGDATRAVWLGAAIAFLVQVALFCILFLWAFSGRPLLAHGLGMLGRVVAVVYLLFWVPQTGLPAAPLLFTLVAVFFATTLLEPLFMPKGLTTSG